MNSLSWFIYLFSVLSGIVTTFQIVVFVCLIVFVLLLVFGIMAVVDNPIKDEKEKNTILFQKLFKRNLIVLAVCCFALIVVPNERTMMLITASQYGEKLAQSDTAKEIADPAKDLLLTWLKQEINKLKKETEK